MHWHTYAIHPKELKALQVREDGRYTRRIVGGRIHDIDPVFSHTRGVMLVELAKEFETAGREEPWS